MGLLYFRLFSIFLCSFVLSYRGKDANGNLCGIVIVLHPSFGIIESTYSR